MLNIGDKAPAFSAPNADMSVIDSENYFGNKKIVLFFYPKDNTPGCIMEAVGFTDNVRDFEEQDVIIIGVSMDDCESHGSFRDKHGLEVILLADTSGEICRAYDVLKAVEMKGQTINKIQRTTYIIDKEAVIKHVLTDVKPKGHAEEVLALVNAL